MNIQVLVGRTVVHNGLGIVGRVKAVHAPGQYRPASGVGEGCGAPTEWVVELESGHAFLAPPSDPQPSFFELNEQKADFHSTFVEGLADCVAGAMVYAVEKGIDAQVAVDLIQAAMTDAARRLGRR